MLNHLRAEAFALIATTSHCTLSTTGPAGVQASIVTCVVHDDCVYALVPTTADHLFNLEYDPEVVLTTSQWQVRGAALVIGRADGLRGTAPHDVSMRARTAGYALVEVFPLRMHIEATGQRRYRETIDFDVAASNHLCARDRSSL
jgi:pyridoxamine 5'-phosphate oxidase-like protein